MRREKYILRHSNASLGAETRFPGFYERKLFKHLNSLATILRIKRNSFKILDFIEKPQHLMNASMLNNTVFFHFFEPFIFYIPPTYLWK